MASTCCDMTIDRIYRYDGDGALKAFVDLNIAGSFLVTGFRVVVGKEGLFVGMPRQQGKNGQWFDSVRPLSRDVRTQLTDLVLQAYHEQAQHVSSNAAAV